MRLSHSRLAASTGLLAGMLSCAGGCAWVAGVSDHVLADDVGTSTDAAPDADASVEGDAAVEAEAAVEADGPGSDDASEETAEASTLVCGDAAPDGMVCSFTLADCNGLSGDGCETDLAVDSRSCGACGRDCRDGDCTSGTCMPYVLFSDPGEVLSLAVWGNQLMWADRTTETIRRADKAGGADSEFASGQNDVYEMAADASGLYWSTPGTGQWQLRAKSWGGGPVVAVADTAPYVSEILLDATHVYWVDVNDSQSVKRLAKAGGGQPTVIVRDQTSLSGAALDADFVYFTSGASGQTGSIRRAPKDGQNVEATVLASDLNDPDGIAVVDGTIYFTTDSGRGVYSIPITGGEPVPLATGLGRPIRILTDEQFIYWREKEGGVRKMSRCPGASPVLLSAAIASYFAQDADSLYISEALPGRISRTTK